MMLDSSAWIEFFIESNKGDIVRHHLRDHSCYTSIVSIAEISNWALKQNRDGRELIKYARELSQILDLTEKIAFLAGELNFQRKKIEKNWGMLDSFILATAQTYNLKVLTKDSQFKDLQTAELL